MFPPEAVHALAQILFVMETLDGGPLKEGQSGVHTVGAVVAEEIAETHSVVVLRHRA
jgi:hypothetical protein